MLIALKKTDNCQASMQYLFTSVLPFWLVVFISLFAAQARAELPAGYELQPVGGGVNNSVFAVHAAGNDVYYGGAFTQSYNALDGVVPVDAVAHTVHVARWDGVEWHALGRGTNNTVYTIARAADGSVYVGGAFTEVIQADGTVLPAAYIARFKNGQWQALDEAINNHVYVIEIIERAAEHDVYIGGYFGPTSEYMHHKRLNNIARWDGSAWHELAGGLPGTVFTIEYSADRGGIYIGGSFDTSLYPEHPADSVIKQVAFWDIKRLRWQALGTLDLQGYGVASINERQDADGVYVSGSGVGLRYFTWSYTQWRLLDQRSNLSTTLLPDQRRLISFLEYPEKGLLLWDLNAATILGQKIADFEPATLNGSITIHAEGIYLGLANVVDEYHYAAKLVIPDMDGDGIANDVDNCPLHANTDQLDSDDDGQGDVCSDDMDRDGVKNAEDLCPRDALDKCINNPDADTDSDGVINSRDEMPEDSRRWFAGEQQLPKQGDAAKQRYGQVLVNLGDVDGDFIDDYAIGTPQYRATRMVNEKAKRFVKAGRVEIFSGKTGVRLFDEQGAAAKQLFGSAIVSGDFNDDDIVDIAVGSPGANKNTGAVYMYLGNGSGSFSVAEILTTTGQPKALFGASLAAAELDGKQQLFVGMPKAKNSDIKKITGAVARYQQGLFDQPALRFGGLVKSEYGAALLWLPKAQSLAIGAPAAYKTGLVDIWNVAQNTSKQLQGGYVGERYGSVMAVGSLLAGAEHLAVAGPLASSYGFKQRGRIELFDLAIQEGPIDAIEGLTSGERLGSSLAFAVPFPNAGDVSVDALYAGSPNYSVPKSKKFKQVGKVSELSFGGVRDEEIGTHVNQQFGAALAAIELNGDFCTELLIHSPGVNDPNNKKVKVSGRVDAYTSNGLYPMQALE